MSAAATLLLLVPFWPGVLALTVLVLRRWRTGGTLALAGVLPALAVGLRTPGGEVHDYPWILLGSRLGVGPADRIYLLFTALVWLLAGAYARAALPRDDRREGFFACFLFTMSGTLGTLVARDMPSFYALYALMSFAAYGLIAYHRSAEAMRAARVYIVLVVAGEAAIAAAMLVAAGSLGGGEFAIARSGIGDLPRGQLLVALAFLGFGIKAGVLILHVWLPLAHPVAPAPASAVLSGTIIVTGLVGWLRFLPLGEIALPAWGAGCVLVGLAAAFYAALVGTDQHDPKVVLAYSSISQMGIMTVAVGMMLLEPALVATMSLAVAFFAMHHGLAKCALFLGAGLGATDLDRRQRRWLVTALALPSLALAGAPLTSGMLAKSALLGADAVAPMAWIRALHVLLPLTSVVTALLMGRFLVLVARARGRAGRTVGAGARSAFVASLILVAFLPWWFVPAAVPDITPETLTRSLGPLLLAVAVGAIAIHAWRRAGRPPVPEVPAGDVLVPIEAMLARLAASLEALARSFAGIWRSLERTAAAAREGAWAVVERSSTVEASLARWPTALLLALLLGAVLAIVTGL